MKNYIAPSKATTQDRSGIVVEHEMSRSGPWGTSAASKGAHSGVRSQPLRGHPQREGHGQMRTPAGGRG